MIHILRMKSLAMINFNRISPSADFYSKIESILLKLEILNKNVLYSTHELDKIKKLLTDKDLQHQVDEFFEETSPQTESVEQ